MMFKNKHKVKKEHFVIKKGEEHFLWKGDLAGNGAKHIWVRKMYGSAYRCEKCGIEGLKRYHWSNIDHKYKRDIKDWQQLCPKCHYKYDKENIRIIDNRPNRKAIPIYT